MNEAYEKLRESWGMLFIRLGAVILLKHKDSYKLYMKHNGKMELLGELDKKYSFEDKQ